MSGPRITLVLNPAADAGRGAAAGERVAAWLATRCELTVLATASAAEATQRLAATAVDADAVFACGGDGTVHLAVNALAGGTVPLGIVPAGSGNDAATVLGVPAEPLAAAQALLAALAAGSVRPIDLGRICVQPGAPAGEPGRWWVGMLYAGFDSRVNERANRMRYPHGRHRYDVAIAAELLRLQPRTVRIGLDGVVIEQPVTLIAVGNGPQYGGGKQMTPTARMDDGLLDVTVVGPVSRLTLARLAPLLPRAGHIGHPAVAQYRARVVSLVPGDDGPPLVAYADGERLGPLPVSTRCMPAALRVLVPVGATVPALAAPPG